jgi:hypothetical protein
MPVMRLMIVIMNMDLKANVHRDVLGDSILKGPQEQRPYMPTRSPPRSCTFLVGIWAGHTIWRV